MKFLVVFVVCIVSVYGGLDPEFKKQMVEMMQTIGKECAKQENASPDDIASILAKIVPQTTEGKCMLACFNEKIGVQTADGKPSMDGAMKSIAMLKDAAPECYDKMEVMMKKCIPAAEAGSERCDYAAKFAECATVTGKELGLDEVLM